jgi:hypothetical protein
MMLLVLIKECDGDDGIIFDFDAMMMLMMSEVSEVECVDDLRPNAHTCVLPLSITNVNFIINNFSVQIMFSIEKRWMLLGQ